MTLGVQVEGGTGAGRRRVKVRPEWECSCPGEVVADGVTVERTHPGDVYSCPDCGERRPS